MIGVLTDPDSPQRRYLSALRAAKTYGQRPTAMLLHDPYAGHRKWWSEYLYGQPWVPGESDQSWTTWDYILADVLQVIEDFTDSESGQLMWLDQSGDVWWESRRIDSGYLAAVEKAQEDAKTDEKGVRYYAVPIFDPNKPKPTLESWLNDNQEDPDRQGRRVPSDHKGARPPTPDEIRRMRESRPVE